MPGNTEGEGQIQTIPYHGGQREKKMNSGGDFTILNYIIIYS